MFNLVSLWYILEETKSRNAWCAVVLASSALKPSKLKRHLVTHHPDFQNKDADFFKRRADSLVRWRFDSTGDQWKENTAGLKASYVVARKIAIAKKPHTIGEQLILPCCQVIVSNVFGEAGVQKLKQVSLSNDTVSRRISELSENILSQLVPKIQKSMFGFFAIQLDETTDVANLAELCVYVRYIHEGIWRMNFCFAVPTPQEQLLKKFSISWTSFSTSTTWNGNTLSAFAQAVLQLCLVAVPVFRLWLRKNLLMLLVRIALFIAKHSWQKLCLISWKMSLTMWLKQWTSSKQMHSILVYLQNCARNVITNL